MTISRRRSRLPRRKDNWGPADKVDWGKFFAVFPKQVPLIKAEEIEVREEEDEVKEALIG